MNPIAMPSVFPGAAAGLSYLPELITEAEESALSKELDRIDWETHGTFRRRGRVVRRREIDFSHDYGRHSRTISKGMPLPAYLEPIRDRSAKAAGLAPERIQQVIAILYRPGAGIDWHVDSIDAFGDLICSVSLGSACTMHFRPAGEKSAWKITLERRSLLLLRGPSRLEYEHRIPPVRFQRYSVTMRTLRT